MTGRFGEHIMHKKSDNIAGGHDRLVHMKNSIDNKESRKERGTRG